MPMSPFYMKISEGPCGCHDHLPAEIHARAKSHMMTICGAFLAGKSLPASEAELASEENSRTSVLLTEGQRDRGT